MGLKHIILIIRNMTERRYLIMKKITAIVLLMAMVFSLAGCGNSVSIGAFSSKYFNYDDYDAAVQEVMTYFKEIGRAHV